MTKPGKVMMAPDPLDILLRAVGSVDGPRDWAEQLDHYLYGTRNRPLSRVFVGIVGHEAAKFTPETEAKARALIRTLLAEPECVLVSGHCHLGGIDIWAEEEAEALGRHAKIFPPAHLRWADGFKPRNIQIAEASDVVHCLVVSRYPDGFEGMRFRTCYHCHRHDHVKSGGCWTAKYAERALKKPARWHVL